MKKGLQYKRILLKMSGEALKGKRLFGIDPNIVNNIALQIKQVYEMKVEIAIVVGGGNIWRASFQASEKNIERVTADYMGMLATVINALALQNFLEKNGVATRVLSSIEMQKLAEPYIRRRAIRHLEKRRVVIFAGGTGNPYFTTDTAAALRAIEINADVILKGTKVDGIYNKDPLKYGHTKKFIHISYLEAINRRLKIMDTTAVSLCMDNNLPIIVFNLNKKGNLKKIVKGENIGTSIR